MKKDINNTVDSANANANANAANAANAANDACKRTIAPLRVGVIGAGNMGQHHLRVYNMLSNTKLVGVVDIDEKRAESLASKFNCSAYTNVEDLIGKVDAVSIAVPSNLHASIGEFFLNHNVHCLIEKPLAISEAECLRLIKIAEKKGVILLVGHVEHFNPGLQTMANILKDASQIYAIDAKRMGFNAYRISDIDVVLDLMVHDLEIISFLHDEEVTGLSAQGIRTHTDQNIDQATSLLSFASGAIATLSASWIAAKKTRTLEVSSDIGTLCLDYSTQKLVYYKKPPSPSLSSASYSCEAQLEYISVRYQEPLLLELQNFIQSIDAGVLLGVNGYQALNALKLAWKIQEKIQNSDKLQHTDKLQKTNNIQHTHKMRKKLHTT